MEILFQHLCLRSGSFALHLDLSLEFSQKHPIVYLRGPSGAGKSQFLHLLMGLRRPQRGQLVVNGEVWSGPKHFLTPAQRPVALMFQNARLFPHLSVQENLAYCRPAPQRLNFWAQHCELEAHLGRYPSQLSGGEQQRVALARTLLKSEQENCRLLILDEPFSALNPRWRARLAELIQAHLRAFGLHLLLASHDSQLLHHWPEGPGLWMESGHLHFGEAENFNLY